MMTMKRLVALALISGFALSAAAAEVQEASAPRGVTVSIYDTGLAMVNEARRVSLAAGENLVTIGTLPREIDASSASFGSVARDVPFELLDQVYRYDLAGYGLLFGSMVGQPVALDVGGEKREGILLGPPVRGRFEQTEGRLPVRSRDGKDLWMIGVDELSSVTFPFARDELAYEPELLWRVKADKAGPQNFRLSYRTDGITWKASYQMLLDGDSPSADFSARIQVENNSGVDFENARVRLLQTEKGMAAPIVADGTDARGQNPAMRYQYGAIDPAFERSVASMAPMETYELPRAVTLEDGRPTYVQLAQSSAMPIKQFYVYDGVRFDRFQRNSRTDWNYGTEYHTVVQTHVEFDNKKRYGLGENLPPGLCRLYRIRADGSVDLLGDEYLLPMQKDGKGFLRIGPARGLIGERERTGYLEVKPHHIYEESFEIRLANNSQDAATVKVVEHLYRWNDYQIVRADADFKETNPQTIEFEITLQPGGRRSVHYTVRYNW